MPDINFDYNTYHNFGFGINPEYRGFDGMNSHRAMTQALYYYANTDRNEEAAEKAREIFGPAVLPLDSPNTNYFVGQAYLERMGYTGSPYQYYIQNNLPIPEGLEHDTDAYELIGQELISNLRNAYDQEQRLNQELRGLETTMPQMIAREILNPAGSSATLSGRISPEAYSTLAENGVIDSYERSRLRANNAWSVLGNPSTAEDFRRLAANPARMASVAEMLQGEDGDVDELAFMAFFTALEDKAREAQPEDSAFWDALLTNAQMFVDNADRENLDEATRSPNAQLAEFAYQNAIASGKSQAEAEREAQALDPNRSARTTPATRRLIAAMRIAVDTATSPDERAAWYSSGLTRLGKISGQSLIPSAAAVAATYATRGRSTGMLGLAARGWFGSYAASRDSLINTSRYNAYLQGVTNPELYGRLEGEAQAAVEGIFNAAGSWAASWKGLNALTRRLTSAATVRSGLASRPFMRTALAWSGASILEGSGEILEEEAGDFLAYAATSIARSTGVNVSLNEYSMGDAISQMDKADIAAIYAFSAIMGVGGAAVNYNDARQLASDRATLTRYFGRESADKITERSLAADSNIAHALASNLSEQEKQRVVQDEQNAFLSFLSQTWETEVLNNPDAVKAHIEEDNRRIISDAAIGTLMESGAAVMGLRKHGFLGAAPQGDGNYEMTFFRQSEGEDSKPTIEHRVWSREQLVNFLRMQADTKLYEDILAFQNVLLGHAYAKAASTEETEAAIISLRETKAYELMLQHGGMTIDFFEALAEAAKSTPDIIPGLSQRQIETLAQSARERKANAKATSEGKELAITDDTQVIFPAFNSLNEDGSGIIAYVAGHASLNDILEERFETHVKRQLASGKTLQEIGDTIAKIEERMPNITLLERQKDGSYTKGAIVEAYSKLAQANMLVNLASMTDGKLDAAQQEVLRDVLSTMRKGKLIKTLGDAWLAYTNSEEGKQHLANGGRGLMEIMQKAGYTFGEAFRNLQVSAQQRMEIMEALGFADFEQQAQEIAEGAEAQDEATIANVQEQADVTPEEQQEHAVKAGYDPESGELATDGQLTHIDEKTGREATRNMDGSVTITINPNQIFVADVLKDTPIIKANFDASGQEIVAIRDDAGKLHAVSGISQLQNAKEQGVNFTKVTIFDNFKAWSNDNIIAYNAYQNIISGQGLTQDYANYFRYSGPLSNAEVMEQGLGTPNEEGEMPASLEAGRAIAEQATEEDMQQLNKGKLPKKKVKELVQKAEEAKVPQDLLNLRKKIAEGKATAKDFAEFFVNNPITHAAAIEMGIVPLTKENQPTEAYIEGRKEAEYILAAKAEADAAAEAKAKTEKTLPGKTKWITPSTTSKPLSESQTKQTLISVAAHSLSKSKHDRFQFLHVLTQRKGGTEYTVSTDGRRITVISTSTYKEDTNENTQEWHSSKGEKSKEREQAPKWTQVIPSRFRGETAVDFSYYGFLAKGLKGKTGDKHIDSPLLNNGQHIVVKATDGYLSLNPIYVRDAYKQLVDLGKKIGFSPIVKLQYNDTAYPVMFTAEHNGIKWQYVLMPTLRNKQAKPGDIILGEQPTIYSEEMQDTGFSIMSADELQTRFAGESLAERMANFIKRESKRLSKVLTFAPNTETATKAIADVTAIMHSLDKYVENGTFHISDSDRKTLRMLVRLADKYGEMIYSGKFRSLKKADKETAERFKAEVEAIAHEEAIKEQQRKVKFHLKNKDSALKKAETAKTEEERQKYLKLADKHQQLADARGESVSHDDFLAARHKIAAQMAEGKAKEVVETMLDEAGDLLERYLKADISDRINKLLDQIRPKRSASKRFKGKLHASSYRRIDEIIDIMGMSKAAKDSELDAIHYAKQALERGDTPPKGMFPVLDDIREKLGDDAATEDIIEALNKREADVLTFGCIDGMTYLQAREAFNAFYLTLRMRRTAWEMKQEMEKNKIHSIIYDFFGVDPSNLDEAELDVSKLGTDQNLRDLKDKLEKAKFTMPDSYMNAAQLFYALSSFKGLEGVFSDFMYKLSNNKIARELHLSDMRKKELRAFAAIKGMKPTNSEEGFSDKELKGKVAAKFDDFFEANNKRVKTGITHTYTKKIKGVTGEVTEELELTKWEALDLILQYRQDDYKSNAESYGFTQDVMQKLEDFCGKDLMAFGNYIQQAIVNDGTVPVYEARTGVPMKENPKYFPSSANINTLNITSKEPLVNPQTGINPFGWQKERVKHDEELKASNAYTKYRLALTSRANYVYFEPITHMLERLLADKTFANGLHKAIGSQLFGQLIETINEIKGAAWQETVMQDVNNDKIMKAFATHALLTLPMKVTTLLRQLTSVANAGMLPGLNVVTCLPHIAGVFSGSGHKTFFDILNLPAFESRKRDNAFVNELMNMGNDATFSRALILARKGMDWIDRWDLCANAFSATVVYNHKYAQLEKQGGLSVTEMEKQAEQEVNLYLALLAQPLSRLDKSALYWRWSQNVLGRAFMYMGSESIQKVGMARAAYIVNKNNGDGGVKNWTKLIVKTGLSIGTASFLVGLANALIRGETPDEDDNMLAWYLATFLSESVGQYTDYLPAVGPIIDTALSPYAGWGEVKERIPGVSAITHGTKLYTMLTDDKDYSPAEWEMQLNRFNTELVPAFSALGYGTYSPLKWFSMATSTLTSLNAIGNLIYPFARGASNNAAWLPILPEGLEEFINKDDTRKPRRRKSLAERKIENLID